MAVYSIFGGSHVFWYGCVWPLVNIFYFGRVGLDVYRCVGCGWVLRKMDRCGCGCVWVWVVGESVSVGVSGRLEHSDEVFSWRPQVLQHSCVLRCRMLGSREF